MKFIFSTGSLYTYSVARCMDFAAQASFDGIELMVDHRWDTRQAAYLQSLIDRYEQPILAVHSPFIGRIPGWPRDEVARIKESVKLAEAVRAKVVVHHLPFRMGWFWLQAGSTRLPLPHPFDKRHQAYQQWLEGDYVAFQASTDVKVCIENMPARQRLGRRWSGYRWNSPSEIIQFPAITLDTTHLGTWGIEPSAVYDQFQGRVQHVHLSNFDGREHRLPEYGHLQLDQLLTTLATTDYAGLITLELHPDTLQAGKADAVIVELLKNSLAYCREWAGRQAPSEKRS